MIYIFEYREVDGVTYVVTSLTGRSVIEPQTSLRQLGRVLRDEGYRQSDVICQGYETVLSRLRRRSSGSVFVSSCDISRLLER